MMRAAIVVLLLCASLASAQTYAASTLPGMVSKTSWMSGKYELHWNYSATEARLYVAIRAQTNGWVGLGIAEVTSASMAGADMLIASVHDTTGAVTVEDRYATAKAMPVLDTTQDWTACSTGASQSGGYTTVYASRLVVTGDKKQDRDIPQGTVPIVIAWGGSDSFGQHASDARMMASVKFYGSNYAEYSTTVTSAINPQTSILTVKNYPIPAQETTYAFQAWELPSADAHIVAVNMKLNATTSAYVHHLVLHECMDTAFFRALINTPTGNPYPVSTGALSIGGVLGSGSSTPASLTGQSSVCKGPFFAWAHGSEGLVMPPNVGFKMGANGIRYVIAEIHYNNPSLVTNLVDSTGFELVYTTSLLASGIDAGLITIGDPLARFSAIPANQQEVHYEAVCSSQCTSLTGAGQWPASGINVFGSFLHMHQAGTMMWNTHTRNGQMLGVRGKVEYWDFNNQVSPYSCYKVMPGDRINTHCVYKNSGSTAISFGTASIQEMMTNMPMCGYFQDGQGNTRDFCGKDTSTGILSSNNQALGASSNAVVQAQYSDGTTVAKCFGASTVCAQSMTNDNVSCVALPMAPATATSAYCPAASAFLPPSGSTSTKTGAATRTADVTLAVLLTVAVVALVETLLV